MCWARPGSFRARPATAISLRRSRRSGERSREMPTLPSMNARVTEKYRPGAMVRVLAEHAFPRARYEMPERLHAIVIDPNQAHRRSGRRLLTLADVLNGGVGVGGIANWGFARLAGRARESTCGRAVPAGQSDRWDDAATRGNCSNCDCPPSWADISRVQQIAHEREATGRRRIDNLTQTGSATSVQATVRGRLDDVRDWVTRLRRRYGRR